MAPSTHLAAVINRKGDIEVKKIAVPKAGEGEVLVKVVAAALNPTDWKSAKKSGCDFANEVEELTVSGCDFAGVVEELSPGLETASIKVGDRVATCVPGARTPNGAYAEYVTAKARSCIPVPESWTFEQGAQIPVAIFTTFQTLYQSHGLRTPLEVASESIPLLVYGASTSVGLYVLQVAKASNFKTYALCSPKNFDLVKSFGADAVYDYRDREAANKIKAASDGKIQAAIDTISEHGSAKIIVSALSSEGGKIATLLPYSEEDKAVLGSKYAEAFSLAYDVVVDRAGAPSRMGDTPGYVKLASQLLASDKVRPTPIRVWEKGLEGVNDAMQYMMDGKVSGEKLIFRIADTPGLA